MEIGFQYEHALTKVILIWNVSRRKLKGEVRRLLALFSLAYQGKFI